MSPNIWNWRAIAGGAGALYVHVPFCVRKCAYCDFASWGMDSNDGRMRVYARALSRQVEELASAGLLEGCMTAYVGGGTPSMLGPEVLSGLLHTLRTVAPNMRELSCEANPDTLSDEVLVAMREAGTTRVSIGVQSLEDAELVELGRLHDAKTAAERVSAAVATGMDVSVDLMCATPQQSKETWGRTLLAACELGVGHVSVYPLQLEQGTPLGDRYAHDDPCWNEEEVQANRMEMAQSVLSAAGFARYEVASYARADKQCLHNTAYWTGIPYVGVGYGAASMLDRATYVQLRSVAPQLPALEGWVQRVRLSVERPWDRIACDHRLCSECFSVELLNAQESLAEDLMLGMRLSRGIGGALVAQAKEAFGSRFVRTIERLVADGLVSCENGSLVPTQLGWLLGNQIFGALWSLSDNL